MSGLKRPRVTFCDLVTASSLLLDPLCLSKQHRHTLRGSLPCISDSLALKRLRPVAMVAPPCRHVAARASHSTARSHRACHSRNVSATCRLQTGRPVTRPTPAHITAKTMPPEQPGATGQLLPPLLPPPTGQLLPPPHRQACR
eukprot:357611-Chlamydomonas_euryale.AAC.5